MRNMLRFLKGYELSLIHIFIISFAQESQCHTVTAQGRLNDIRNVMLVGFGVKIFQACLLYTSVTFLKPFVKAKL